MSRRDGSPIVGEGVVVGALRVDAAARAVARRVQPGDIAVIDVLDLDRTSAEALATRAPAAVLNVQSSISGRYPAGGASVLAGAGIPLIDNVDSAILTLREGTIATIDFLAPERAAPRDDAERPEGETSTGAVAAKTAGKKSKAVADKASGATKSAPVEIPAGDGKEDSPSDPPTGGVPPNASSATRSNPVTRWWHERAQQRTARKRASLTWLDDLREADADATPRDGDAHEEAKSGAHERMAPEPGTPELQRGKRPTAARTSDPSAPWHVTITAGGLELQGIVMDSPAVDAALAQAEEGMATQLAVFTANAMDVVDRSRDALLEGQGLPELGVDVRGKHVVIVAPGYGAAAALRSIRPYLRDHKPVVIGIGDAAETARKARCQPAVVIGATSAVSDGTLTAARTVITHLPGGEHLEASEARLGALQREHEVSELPVASEDLALLLARAGGAKTIVTVGVDATLLDFLESGRVDAAGTFLARLAVGSRVVDAGTLASVYRPRWSGVVIIAGIVLATIALAAALWANADSRAWIEEVLSVAGVTT